MRLHRIPYSQFVDKGCTGFAAKLFPKMKQSSYLTASSSMDSRNLACIMDRISQSSTLGIIRFRNTSSRINFKKTCTGSFRRGMQGTLRKPG
jgi:hypothetical protein